MNTWKIINARPFSLSTALYIILNGILTINVNSQVLDSLYRLLGYTGLLAPILQIIAGSAMLMGLIRQRSNLESFGMILASALFIIRAIIVTTDGDITLADVNTVIISILITLASAIRINQILKDVKLGIM